MLFPVILGDAAGAAVSSYAKRTKSIKPESLELKYIEEMARISPRPSACGPVFRPRQPPFPLLGIGW